MIDNSRSITFEDNSLIRDLVGSQNCNLQAIESLLDVTIRNRGNNITITGSNQGIRSAESVLKALWEKLEKNQEISTSEVEAAVRFAKNRAYKDHNENGFNPLQNSDASELSTFLDDNNTVKTRKKMVTPRSPLQAKYIEEMRTKDLVFAQGPGGTGKTYLGVAYAVMLYLEGKIDRMIFTRPAVEAGESLGFLPGDIQEKIDPYLRPIYDALYDMMHGDKVAKKIADGDIEVAPLAFMRGRTLKNAFVLLDEAQNTTSIQMKMFLTRMGEGSKMVITGDPSQIDLPPKTKSGLSEAVSILQDVENVGFINFTSEDVVRHKLVSDIINAYEKHGSN